MGRKRERFYGVWRVPMPHYFGTTEVLQRQHVLQYWPAKGDFELSNALHFDEKILLTVTKVIVDQVHNRVEGRAVRRGRIELEQSSTEVDTNADDHTVSFDGESKEVAGVIAVSEDERTVWRRK